MLEIARKRDCAQRLCVANLDTEFPFAGIFSVIYTMYVLHHLKIPEVFIRNAYAHLPAGGHLLIGNETEEDLRLKIKSIYFPGALEIDLARYYAPSKLEDDFFFWQVANSYAFLYYFGSIKVIS